jgi:hypothetical protein
MRKPRTKRVPCEQWVGLAMVVSADGDLPSSAEVGYSWQECMGDLAIRAESFKNNEFDIINEWTWMSVCAPPVSCIDIISTNSSRSPKQFRRCVGCAACQT